MKKTNWYNIINRNNEDIFNPANRTSHTSMMGSDLFLDRLWMGEEDSTGVQITELKSSDGSDNCEDKGKEKNNHDRFLINEAVNENARERRRLRNQLLENQNAYIDHSVSREIFESVCEADNYYRDVYASSSLKNEDLMNHPMNCFTILDKHYMVSENSSEDDMQVTEIMDYEVGNQENPWNNNEADLVPYETDSEREKRMVWIYSFKNKRLLSDNAFELVNIPSTDSISSNALEDVTEFNCGGNVNRLATPIPALLPTFVPRLNLTMTNTLPTLTEVTEPIENRTSTVPTEESTEAIPTQRRLNNWFHSVDCSPVNKINKTDAEKSRNVVDWMGLSPRENTRVFHCQIKNIKRDESSPNVKTQNNNGTEFLQPISEEPNIREKFRDPINLEVQDQRHEIFCSPIKTKTLNNTYEVGTTEDILSRQDVVVHTEIIRHSSGVAQKANTDVQSSTPQKSDYTEPFSSYRSGSTTRKCPTQNTNNTPHRTNPRRRLNYSQMTTVEIRSDQEDTPEDRGDYFKSPRRRRPRIHVTPRRIDGSAISDPIENLDSNNWIIEHSIVEDKRENFQPRRRPNEHGDGSIGNVIFMKHMSLFKPAPWESYLPIAESVPSLSLTADTVSETDSRSWAQRLRNIFLCCK